MAESTLTSLPQHKKTRRNLVRSHSARSFKTGACHRSASTSPDTSELVANKIYARSVLDKFYKHSCSTNNSSCNVTSHVDPMPLPINALHEYPNFALDCTRYKTFEVNNQENSQIASNEGIRSQSAPPGICTDVEPNLLKSSTEASSVHIDALQKDENRHGFPNLAVSTIKPKLQKKLGHVRSQSDVPPSVMHQVHASRAKQCLPLSSTAKVSNFGEKDQEYRRKSLLEDGCCSVVPKTECFFPQPQKGQSLTSFLSSEDFHTCPELDKENAHFYISEALISAVEQIKCNQILQHAEDEVDESDEEISHLKQRIRIRRRERQQEKAKQRDVNLLSDGKTDTTSPSPSPPSSEFSESDIDELEYSDTCTIDSTLQSNRDQGLSLSMASLYSDADVRKFQGHLVDGRFKNEDSSTVNLISDSTICALSAETVALCLLRKFSETQLPKASDLEWLVSEQDAPQSLLPLPDSWPVSPDDVEEQTTLQQTRLRGTFDWAPPRAQIIFSIHPPANRNVLVAKQRFRCAGCGMRIERGYAHRFRLCKYLGKYFCHCCHGNSTAVIPGHVLQKWDFNRYYVSNFSRDLLDRMDADPLFNLMDINCSLYRKCRQLELVQQYRTQLSSLKDYIWSCKDSNRLQKELNCLPMHWIHEPEVYSLQDLVQVKSGKIVGETRDLTVACIQHVHSCKSCSDKGFICETCHSMKSIIFPFQLSKVIQCRACGACFHKTCFVPNSCSKCARIQQRKKKLEEEFLFSEDESS